MDKTAILFPFFAVMGLTLVVWLYMYAVRMHYIAVNNIDASELATPEKLNALIPEHINNPSNNLKNLFELPVLFYALCLCLYVSNSVDALAVYSAWAFVVLRAIHSAVQCTVNIVALRFSCYFMSSLVLWFILLRAMFTLSASL